ncbi:unnamed protein product [Amoebophrya sp. A25]|nr:unnamed protein product [Amoebophrya sp. A25]|eukprot:GSA25T00024097001.1
MMSSITSLVPICDSRFASLNSRDSSMISIGGKTSGNASSFLEQSRRVLEADGFVARKPFRRPKRRMSSAFAGMLGRNLGTVGRTRAASGGHGMSNSTREANEPGEDPHGDAATEPPESGLSTHVEKRNVYREVMAPMPRDPRYCRDFLHMDEEHEGSSLPSQGPTSSDKGTTARLQTIERHMRAFQNALDDYREVRKSQTKKYKELVFVSKSDEDDDVDGAGESPGQEESAPTSKSTSACVGEQGTSEDDAGSADPSATKGGAMSEPLPSGTVSGIARTEVKVSELEELPGIELARKAFVALQAAAENVMKDAACMQTEQVGGTTLHA